MNQFFVFIETSIYFRNRSQNIFSLNKSNINIVITYGKYSYSTFTNLKNSIIKKHFSDIGQLKSYLKKITEKGDLIYLKGSRTMQLERIYKAGLA